MNKKNYRYAMKCLLTAVFLLALLSGCAGGGKNEVYEDMEAAFGKAELLSANIGIVSRTEENGNISYGKFGSGVIIEKRDGAYYALTAAHVVSTEGADILVFTVNTEMKTEDIPGMEDISILTPETYDAMLMAEVVHVSSRDDLALIRFISDEDLSVIEVGENDPEKGDRIMCVGNPQGDWFALSYGKVTSGMEKFREGDSFSSNGLRFNAYIQVGSSGGAAINEEMKLAGIVSGGVLELNGKSFKYGVMVPVSEIRLCMNDWNE